MIRPATAEELEARLKQPDISDLVDPGFDSSGYLALTDGRNILLATEWADKVFEIHWLLVDRGRPAINAGLDFLAYLYDSLGARVVVGQTPAHKRAARWFSRQVGGRSDGMALTEHGEVELFSMTAADFEARNGLSKIQAAFHQHGTAVDQ